MTKTTSQQKRVINGVHVVAMGMANAFLIEGNDGLTLIDAGSRIRGAAVFGAIGGIGRSPDQLKHLIFTHGHPDHIGSAAAIVRETGARTYMHPLDIPMGNHSTASHDAVLLTSWRRAAHSRARKSSRAQTDGSRPRRDGNTAWTMPLRGCHCGRT
jgi:glyoxylase-like metal-dependent hydrolase (beta-lactamase superfamily II)